MIVTPLPQVMSETHRHSVSVVAAALQGHGDLLLCAEAASAGHACVSCYVITQLASPVVWCSVHLWNLSQKRVTDSQ